MTFEECGVWVVEKLQQGREKELGDIPTLQVLAIVGAINRRHFTEAVEQFIQEHGAN